MGEYCKDCHWDVKSNGHLRECVRPKEQAEESAHVAKLESDLANALLQNSELREIVRWFANALEMKTDKLGRAWSFGYWEGADPGLALVNGGEKGVENSRFNAALKLESGELGVILAASREKAIPEKPVGEATKQVGLGDFCPKHGGLWSYKCQACVDRVKKPFSEKELKERLALIENGKCPECGQKVHLHSCAKKRKDETVADMADAEPTGANQHARSGLCWCSLFHDMG
jgi:DNA-directed RNA polymerase subunit RPC12/RpoP